MPHPDAPEPPLPPRKLVFVGRYATLDEHELPATENRPAVRVDAARLRRIADNCNERESATGDMAPAVLGHTTDGAPETEQPPVVGFCNRHAVEPLFDTGRQAIWSDYYVYDDRLAEARNYPRRSVELWPGHDIIDPVALLSASTPERDLGLMQYSRQTAAPESRYRYSAEESMPDEKKDDLKTDKPDAPKKDAGPKAAAGGLSDADVQQVLAALLQTDVMKKLEALVDAMGEGGDGGEAPDHDAGPPDAPEGAAPGREAMKDNYPPPVKLAASCASGTNTSVPDMDNAHHYQHDDVADLRVKYGKQQADIAAVRRENEELRLKYSRSESEKILDRIDADGVSFDRDAELKVMTLLSDENKQAHEKHIRAFYKKKEAAPVAGAGGALAALQYSRPADGSKGPATFGETRDLAEAARKQNKTYEQVVAERYGSPVPTK